MKMLALYCGGEGTDMAFFDPFHPKVGTKVFIPYLAYLIEHERGLVLFDCGPHPQLAVDPHARMGAAADTYQIDVTATDLVINQLTAQNLDPGDITHIVLSHLHYDHAGALECFPNATVLIQHSERDFGAHPPIYQAGDYVSADFDGQIRWQEIEGDYDLFGDGRLLLFPTPGHTKGHQSMLVQLDEQPVILVGDAAPHPRTLATRALPAVLWNPDQMVASWDRLERVAADNRAILIFPHDPNFRSTMKVGANLPYT